MQVFGLVLEQGEQSVCTEWWLRTRVALGGQ